MTKSEYSNYEEDGYDIGSVDTHMHSDQVICATAAVGRALFVIPYKVERRVDIIA